MLNGERPESVGLEPEALRFAGDREVRTRLPQ